MDLPSKLSPEELELKSKYKLLRRLKRSVDKFSSSRKRHFVLQSGDPGPSVKVTSETASNLMKKSLSLRPRVTQTRTQDFKKPECWARMERTGIPAKVRQDPVDPEPLVKESEPKVARKGATDMMDDFEDMYYSEDYMEEHQSVMFQYEEAVTVITGDDVVIGVSVLVDDITEEAAGNVETDMDASTSVQYVTTKGIPHHAEVPDCDVTSSVQRYGELTIDHEEVVDEDEEEYARFIVF